MVNYADGKLSGKKIAVPDAEVASHAIVVSKNNHATMCLVNLKDASVTVEKQNNIDESRGYFSIELKNTPAEIIGDSGSGWLHAEKILNHAAAPDCF